MHTDPIADLLTRIRNASRARKIHITCGQSTVKMDILKVLKAEGYIDDFTSQKSASGHPEIAVTLRTDRQDLQVKRVSKPGRRVYVTKDEIPNVLHGLGLAIISTPKGVMANRAARKAGVGGELICTLW
jgi:small subunit ribosomal protein S8